MLFFILLPFFAAELYPCHVHFSGVRSVRRTELNELNGQFVTNVIKDTPRFKEVWRYVKYSLIDGNIGWVYSIEFSPTGTANLQREERCDAKDLDPKYRSLMQKIDRQIDKEMKKDGSFGHFGSIHTYWRLKKEHLRAQGIEWKSSAELNPNTIYD